MSKLKTSKEAKMLGALAIIIYFTSYVTRINFATIVSEFIRAEGVKMSSTSLIITTSTVAYGVGQLISGYMGDKINPAHVILFGLSLTTLMNIAMPFLSPNILPMAICWGLNGFAQSCMWPPLVKILSLALNNTQYLKLMPLFGISSGGGTLFIYLISPVMMNLTGWKGVFAVSATFGAVAAIIWIFISKNLLKNVLTDNTVTPEAEKNVQKSPEKHLPVFLIGLILIPIAMQGALRDGITTWVPSFFANTFHLTTSASILTTVFLPAFHIIFNFFVYGILRKMKNNVFRCIIVMFCGMSLFLGILSLFGTKAIWFALPCLTGVSGLVHGINALQTCNLQYYFGETDNIAFLSGLFNSAVYVGSSVATYFVALIAEKSGWSSVLISWFSVALLGAVLTAVCEKICNKKGYKYII